MRESRQSDITGYQYQIYLVHIFTDNKLPGTICILYTLLLCSKYTHISFTSGVTQECLKENQFISCALLERKYVLEPFQYVNCTTLLADQKHVF